MKKRRHTGLGASVEVRDLLFRICREEEERTGERCSVDRLLRRWLREKGHKLPVKRGGR